MRSVVLAALLLLVAPAFAADSWLCVEDKATGFTFIPATKTWEQTNFRTDDKYIVKKSSKEGYAWEVTKLGGNRHAECERDFNDWGVLFCTGDVDFRMNIDKLRFVLANPFGYIGGDESILAGGAADTPFMAIGRCSPL